jgi:cysteate synthase
VERRYRLRCSACGSTFADDGVRLDCDRPHAPALLRTVYESARFAASDDPSVLRYAAWLPRGRAVESAARGIVYRSESLAERLGLGNLWIAFNGWWPERGATLTTATFKELEAVAVLARLASDESRTLVVASAGNTAAAFASIAGAMGIPAVVVLPESAWAPLASLVRIGDSVRTVVVADGTYDEAIAVAARIAEREGFFAEGGVRNVARRDGMGTIMLAAAERIGRLPDAYVQAVGSGAGALAAHEAALRLVADGRFGTRIPRLLLAQNAPFAPIHDAWTKRAHALHPRPAHEARALQRELAAAVLGNPAPPYATIGGVRNALTASDGATFAIGNEEAARAAQLFEALEGIDVEPAAGVAVAALIRAVRSGTLAAGAHVLLNVTGGGRSRRERVAVPQSPSVVVARGALAEELARAV